MPGDRLRKPPTIVEIAAELGVSPSTVSRAFTAPRLLRRETVERVRAEAARRGYVPNVHARALSTGVPHTIGLIVPDIANPFFPPMIRAAQREAEQTGHTVLIADTDGDPARERRTIDRLAPQTESLILASSRLPSADLAEVTAKRRVLFLNRDEPRTARILISSRDALKGAVEDLVQRGHRRFLYVAGPRGSWSDTERYGTVKVALAGVADADLQCLRIPQGTYEQALDAGKSIVSAHATAVIAFDDVVAHGVIDALARQRVRIPGDVSVLGCDDTLALSTQPPLTSIALRVTEAARLAVQLVVQARIGEVLVPQRHVLQGEVTARATVGDAPGSAAS